MSRRLGTRVVWVTKWQSRKHLKSVPAFWVPWNAYNSATGFPKISSKTNCSQYSYTPSASAWTRTVPVLGNTCFHNVPHVEGQRVTGNREGAVPTSLPYLNMTFPLDLLIHALLCMKIRYVTTSQNKGSQPRRAVRAYQCCCQHHQPLSWKFSATRIMQQY